MPHGECGVSVSRRKAERAFTREGRSPFEDALENAREARLLEQSNNAQLTGRRPGPKRRPQLYDRDRWLAIARSAIARGAKVKRPGLVEWDASSGCLDPPLVTLQGAFRPYPGFTTVKRLAVQRDTDWPTQYLDIWVPCRKCERCLAKRAAHWAHRAAKEIAQAARTWFATLTFKPEYHARMVMQITKRLGFSAYSQLSPIELLQERTKEGGKLVTLWLKRVRAQSEAPIRYLLVSEPHKSGLPHFHLFVHEPDAMRPVTWRILHDQWAGYGFAKINLVKPEKVPARYVTKYLNKSAHSRVRASAGYGRDDAVPLKG